MKPKSEHADKPVVRHFRIPLFEHVLVPKIGHATKFLGHVFAEHTVVGLGVQEDTLLQILHLDQDEEFILASRLQSKFDDHGPDVRSDVARPVEIVRGPHDDGGSRRRLLHVLFRGLGGQVALGRLIGEVEALARLGLARQEAVPHSTLMLLLFPVAASPNRLAVGLLLVRVEAVGRETRGRIVAVVVAVEETGEAEQVAQCL